MAQLVAVSDSHQRELADLRTVVERLVPDSNPPHRDIVSAEVIVRIDGLKAAVDGIAPALTSHLANRADHNDTLIAELAQMAQLVAVSDSHQRELADLRTVVERLVPDSNPPHRDIVSAEVIVRIDGLKAAVDGIAPALTSHLANRADHNDTLIAELAQMARLIAVGDSHRQELVELRKSVESLVRSEGEAASIELTPSLSAQLEKLSREIALAASHGAGPDRGSEVVRLLAEMGEMAKLVALGHSDRQRITEIHGIVGQKEALDLSRVVKEIHRNVQKLIEPGLAQPAWYHDRLARRRAETEVARLQNEVVALTQRVVDLQESLDEARQSRRKMKKALDRQAHHAEKRAARAQKVSGLRQWVRTAKVAWPVRWMYQRLRPRS